MTAEEAFVIVSHATEYSAKTISEAFLVLEEAYDMGYRLVLCND